MKKANCFFHKIKSSLLNLPWLISRQSELFFKRRTKREDFFVLLESITTCKQLLQVWNGDSSPCSYPQHPVCLRDCHLAILSLAPALSSSEGPGVLKRESQALHRPSLGSRHLRAGVFPWLHQGREGTGKTHFWGWIKAWETSAPPYILTMEWLGNRDLTLGGDPARDNGKNHLSPHLDTSLPEHLFSGHWGQGKRVVDGSIWKYMEYVYYAIFKNDTKKRQKWELWVTWYTYKW